MSTDLVVGHCKTINPYTIVINPQELFKQTKPLKKTKVVTGCPLCDKIWSSKEAYQNFCEYSSRERIVIVMENGKPWLYIPCEDDYYSDTRLQINYCPKCSRKLFIKDGE